MRALVLVGCCFLAVSATYDYGDPIDKREIADEEQPYPSRGDPMYDYDNCMAHCNYQWETCKKMCYYRINDNIPGKRDAMNIEKDNNVIEKREIANIIFTYQDCMRKCKDSTNTCHEECKVLPGYGKRDATSIEKDNNVIEKREIANMIMTYKSCMNGCSEDHTTCDKKCAPFPRKRDATSIERDNNVIEKREMAKPTGMFHDCMMDCEEVDITACRKKCAIFPHKRDTTSIDRDNDVIEKREIESEEQPYPSRGDPMYDYEICMQHCNYRRPTCEQMCYNRIRENIPGKRDAMEIEKDNDVIEKREIDNNDSRFPDPTQAFHRCMSRCQDLKPICRDHCSRAGSKRALTEVFEGGVKRVGSLAPPSDGRLP